MHTLNRRQLLTCGATAAIAAALPNRLAATPERSGGPRIRLGIASYTFRSFDAEHIIDFMKRLRCPNLNVKDVHLPQTPAAEVAAHAAAFTAAGLRLTAGGNITFPQTDAAGLETKFEYCKAAGLRTMVCAPSAVLLPALQELVRKYDIRLAIHNHGPEDRNFPSPLDVLAAVKDLDPRIGLLHRCRTRDARRGRCAGRHPACWTATL